MFIFLRLILAHLIGDFPLQFNKVHALKHKGFWGHLPHIFIIMLCFVALSLPFLNIPEMWAFILFIGVTHLVQDWIKIRFCSKKGFAFISYMLDQILHLSLIASVFLTELRYLNPVLIHDNAYDIYYNDTYILIFITMITITYNGHYMILMFKKDYIDENTSYSTFEKYYGMIERALAFIIFLYSPIFLIILPLIFLFRIVLYLISKKRLSVEKQFCAPLDISLSAGLSIIAGIIARSVLF